VLKVVLLKGTTVCSAVRVVIAAESVKEALEEKMIPEVADGNVVSVGRLKLAAELATGLATVKGDRVEVELVG